MNLSLYKGIKCFLSVQVYNLQACLNSTGYSQAVGR